MKKPNNTIRLLDEAVALERAGGTWSQQHAAVITGYSPAYLRRSTCPKDYEEQEGPKGKFRVVYDPPKVRAWKAAIRVRQSA